MVCCPSLIIVHVRVLVGVVGVRLLRSLAEALVIRICWVSEALLGCSLGAIKELLRHQMRLSLIILLHRINLVSYCRRIILIMRTMTRKTNRRIVLRHDWEAASWCILLIQRGNIVLVGFSCTLIAISRLLILVEITPLESIVGNLAL